MADEPTRTRRGKVRTTRPKVENGGFEAMLTGWGSSGATIVSADNGHFVHSGTQAAVLSGANAFLTQTVRASRAVRLQLVTHIRGVADQANGPVVIRLRWVDSSGSYISTALEIFIPQKQLSRSAWTTLWDVTNQAPSGTAGLNFRVDAPQSEANAGVVIDDVVLM